MAKRQQEAHVKQQLRQLESQHRARAATQSGRLMVPVGQPLKSTDLIPSLFNINRLGANRPAPVPKIVHHQIDARPTAKADKGSGIVIYGVNIDTRESVPILIIKTRLITKQVRTDLPAPSNTVLVRTPADPLVIDLSRFDDLRNINSYCDAYIINVGGDFAFLGGMGAGLQIVIIVKGGDQGIYVYTPKVPNANLGLSLSMGMSTGTVYFNKNNFNRSKNSRALLTRGVFSGNSQGWNIGVGDFGGGVITSYADEERHYKNALGLDRWNVQEEDVMYRAIMGNSTGMVIPTEVAFGVQYSFSRSELPKWGAFPFNRQ